ncbi:hypothetical protein [Nocardia amikacinitolerans]|uniref:hypothetical protein n=1 Tax=Nocardia amikacinitolerans TaxID=756689 RepID=UPI0020A44D40|nr:hypothetical protein [Nocardia amikacinitolerans]
MAVIVLASAAPAISGCGKLDSASINVGDCGYFTDAPGARPWDLQRCDCADREAALIVVRETSTIDCPDHDFSRSSRGKNRTYICTHLNAQVGDCFNDPDNRYAHLYRLRKVPCSPGAYQVNTRVERHDYGVCTTATRNEYGETASIAHKQPPVSFCLHRR